MLKHNPILLIIILFYPLFINSQNWVQVGNGSFGYNVNDMFVDTTDNSFYIGGHFLSSTNDTIKGIAKWNGTKWDSLGNGLGNFAEVNRIIKFNDELYAGGAFNITNGAPVDFIGKWNGILWQSAGGDPSTYVFDLTIFNNELYGVGHLGGQYCIAKWDGSNWNNIGVFSCGLVTLRSLAVYKGELYIAGLFNNDSCKVCIERWNGSSWQCVGNGITPGFGIDNGIYDMVVYNDELFVAGGFAKSDGNPDNSIARWDGNSWHSVGGGINLFVNKMTVFNNELYACGNFTTAGGILANKIAKWDGTQWCSLGSTIYNSIYSACVYNNEFYIGGTFTQIDGYPINHIAKWIGGNYVDTCGTIGISEVNVNQNDVNVYPNPTVDDVYIDFGKNKVNRICLYNINGALVFDESIRNKQSKVLNISELKSGIYFLQVLGDNFVRSKKIIKL